MDKKPKPCLCNRVKCARYVLQAEDFLVHHGYSQTMYTVDTYGYKEKKALRHSKHSGHNFEDNVGL